MQSIFVTVGTRPEAIKLAPIIKQLKRSNCKLCVCSTGQHKQLLDDALSIFDITADVHLNVMRPNQTLASVAADIIYGINQTIFDIRPDWIVVHGDTATTLAAALTAFYNRVKIAHVEAGLRTGDLAAPWPEEMHRKLVDTISSLHFTPSTAATDALLKEGIPLSSIWHVGNTVADALLWLVDRIHNDTKLEGSLFRRFSYLNPNKLLVLVTCHRRESFGAPLVKICEELQRLARRTDIQIVYPVHPNPNVLDTVTKMLGDVQNICLIEPQDYAGFVYLILRSYLIITDSGGVQEEAPYLGKPVLVARGVTERPEVVKHNAAKLVGTDIADAAIRLLDNSAEYESMAKVRYLYGNGRAAELIVSHLLNI